MGLIMSFLLIKASICVSLALSVLSLFHLYIVLPFSLPHTDKALEPQGASQKLPSKIQKYPVHNSQYINQYIKY